MIPARRLQPATLSNNAQCGGFTLIETLLALGIAGMLLAAIGVSLDLFWKHRKLSHTRMTSSQTLRGIVEDLTQDLRGTLSVVAAGPPALNPEAFASAADSLNADRGSDRAERTPSSDRQPGQEQVLSVREQFLTVDGPGQSTPAHFVGTSTIMAVYQKLPNSRFENAVGQYVQPQGYHAVWYVGSTTVGRIAVGRRGNQPETANLAALKAEQLPQLMRASRLFGSDREFGRVQQQSVSVTAISDQVKEIRFRYLGAKQDRNRRSGLSQTSFDPLQEGLSTESQQWFDAWDSTERQALPVAVECRLTLVSSPQQPFTFIIRLPQSSANKRG